MIYNAPIPPEIASDEELLMLYQERMDEIRLPVEDKGRKRLESVLEIASTQKLWSEWQTKALDLLSDRIPGEFAPEKDEVRGQPDSTFVPSGGPISVRPPAEKKKEAGQ